MTEVLEVPHTKATMPLSKRNVRPQPSASAERIVLTGFMGSGKSTVGRLLAEQMGWSFMDLDSLIEHRTGTSVPQIFAEAGENEFRRHETAALAAALRSSRCVIALGGGAPETLGNRLLLEQTPATAVIFLSAPFEVLTSRCARQAANPDQTARPVLADLPTAEARFAARLPLYCRLAHVVVDTAGATPEQTVSSVLQAVAATALPA